MGPDYATPQQAERRQELRRAAFPLPAALEDVTEGIRAERDEAVRLLERALHLAQNGEQAPGGRETWDGWTQAAEAFLRSRAARESP